MRITIETTEAECRAVSFQPGQAQAATASAADADGGPAPQALLMALRGETAIAAAPPGAGGTNAGGPPAWLEEMISSPKRLFP